ncbi:hypothetical protein EV121DRAFT_293107 [Schizophyllum commune]
MRAPEAERENIGPPSTFSQFVPQSCLCVGVGPSISHPTTSSKEQVNWLDGEFDAVEKAWQAVSSPADTPVLYTRRPKPPHCELVLPMSRGQCRVRGHVSITTRRYLPLAMKKGQMPEHEREQQQTIQYNLRIDWGNKRDTMDINDHADYSRLLASACRKGRSSTPGMSQNLRALSGLGQRSFSRGRSPSITCQSASRNPVLAAILERAQRDNLCCDAKWHANTPPRAPVAARAQVYECGARRRLRAR